MFDSLKTAAASLLFPLQCRVCGRLAEDPRDGVICAECWADARIFNGSETHCTKCGAFLRASPPAGETYCRQCDEMYFDMARAVGIYDGAIAALIVALKRKPHLPERAGRLLIESAEKWMMGTCTRIIPVPLSRQREKERGYNQAVIIGRYLSHKTGIPLDERSLVRSVHTPIHRAGMDRKAREQSVKNSFEVIRPKLIEGQSVLLVDDVLTTGATVSYCARVLRKSGALSVKVLTLGRAGFTGR